MNDTATPPASVESLTPLQSITISEAQRLIDAGAVLGKSPVTHQGMHPAIVVPDHYKVVPLVREVKQTEADRVDGTTVLTTPESFAAYVAKYMDSDSQLIGDREKGQVRCVFDFHRPGADGAHRPRLGVFIALLALKYTKEWMAWTTFSNKWMTQTELGEFFEDQASVIVSPDAATMLEVATSLTAARKVDFRSSKRLTNGQVQFNYNENLEGRAGESGNVAIPERFTVRLRIWEGTMPVQFIARFRYRLEESKLRVGFILNEEDQAVEAGFSAVCGYIETLLAERQPVAPPRILSGKL